MGKLKNRMKIFTFMLTAILVGSTLKADIFDRIDDCEDEGGGACVFDLLRELARAGSGGGNGGNQVETNCFCAGATMHCESKRSNGSTIPFSNEVRLHDSTECGDMLKLARSTKRFCRDEVLMFVNEYERQFREGESQNSYGYCLLVASNQDLSGTPILPELSCRGSNSNGSGSFARGAGCSSNGSGCWFPGGGCHSSGGGCWLPEGSCASNGSGCFFEGRKIKSMKYFCKKSDLTN